MNKTSPIFRFPFRFIGIPETAQATLFSVPTPLRGRAESGNGDFRLFQPFPFFDTSAENEGQR